MAWRRRYTHILAAILMAVAGCTEAHRSWMSRNKKPSGPPVAMQPVTLEGPAESAVQPEGAPEAADQAANRPASQGNSKQVLAYLERLPSDSPAASPSPPQPAAPPAASPTTTPAPAPVEAPSATSITPAGVSQAPQAATNTPVSIVADEGEKSSHERSERRATAAPTVAAVRIRSASTKETADANRRPLSTNAPLDAAVSEREMTVSRYLASLEAAVKTAPTDVEAQWRLSALRLALGEEGKALEMSKEIAQEPAGVLKGAVELMAGARKLLTDPVQTADPFLAQLDDLREKLSGRAELEIPVVALCTRVMTFGVYDEMPIEQIVPYQANRAIVYSEVRNFASRPGPDGQYETLLSGRLELLTKDGRSIWQHEEPQIRDVSKQRRGDFFLAQLVSLPPTITAGDYVLKVTIQDQIAAKTNEGRLEFSVKGTQLTRK